MKKRCTKCLKIRKIECFSKHSKNIGHYQSWCKGCVAQNRRRWKKANPEKVKAYDAKYRGTRTRREYVTRYRKSEEYRKQQAEYRRNNRANINYYYVQRAATDPDFKLRLRLRSRIYMAFKERRYRCGSNTEELIGCKFDALKKHIESQFKDGMTWGNYGSWHIDHIKPLHMFDLKDAKEQKKAFHYKNLQPLGAKENMSKNGKYKK